MRKLNGDEVKQHVESLGYELINEYINISSKLIFKSKEGYILTANFDNLRRGKKPKFVSTKNPFTIENIKLWCIINNKPFVLVSAEYKQPYDLLEWKCLKEKCGEIFPMSWNTIQQGHTCGYCNGFKVSKSNSLGNNHPDLAKEWNFKRNKKSPYEYTKSSNKLVWWICSKCRNEWKCSINNRTGTWKTGCPICNESKGEKKIRKWIEDNNLDFEPQKEFEGLIGTGGGFLSYDFYLPKHNILIEYQGEFHDGTPKHQSVEKFKKQLEHDKRKREYAEQNGIELFEIWYLDYENIEEILKDKLI